MASTPHSVLILDEDESFRSSLATALVKRGYVVARAGSAADARERLQRRTFDLLVVDPVLSGPSAGAVLLEELRTRHAGRVLVISTAFRGATSRLPFLAKPAAPEVVLEEVERVLAQSAEVVVAFKPQPSLVVGRNGTAVAPANSLKDRVEELRGLVRAAESTASAEVLQRAHRFAQTLRRDAGRAGELGLELKADRVEGLLDAALQVPASAIRWGNILAAFDDLPTAPVRIGGLRPAPRTGSIG